VWTYNALYEYCEFLKSGKREWN